MTPELRISRLSVRLGGRPVLSDVSLDLALYNILDDDFEIATDTPGWGRTFVGSLSVRF